VDAGLCQGVVQWAIAEENPVPLNGGGLWGQGNISLKNRLSGFDNLYFRAGSTVLDVRMMSGSLWD
jgi:hypothetical protein